MREVLAFVLGLMAVPVAAWLVRIALAVVTMPMGHFDAVVGSRTTLRVLRLVVGVACGAGALLAGRWVVAACGGVPGVTFAVAAAVTTAAYQVRAVWPMRGTHQLVDDMLWLVGEEIGIVAVAVALLRVS